VRRWRGVRVWRRDRYCHRPPACARAGRGRAAYDLQVSHPRQRADQTVTCERSRAPRGGRVTLPPHAPGLKIGLFGGPFHPPHPAHLAASLLAMKRLGLDRIWWLVTPGNPLKDTRHLETLERRMAAVRELTRHPRIDASALEAQIGTRYT